MLGKIRSYGKYMTPKHIVQQIEENEGGSFSVNARDVPRDKMQVHNMLRDVACCKRSRDTGPVKTADQAKLLTMMKCGDFLQNVSQSKKAHRNCVQTFPRTFAASTTHLKWIKSYCNPKNAKASF